MLLSEVPKLCPQCDTRLFASIPKPSISKKAILVALAGVPLTGIWLLLFFLFSPVYVTPRGLDGIIMAFFVYAWPLGLTVIYGSRMPEVISAKCYKCQWGEVFQIKPKGRKVWPETSLAAVSLKKAGAPCGAPALIS